MKKTAAYNRAVTAEPDLRAVEKVIRAIATLNVTPGTAYDSLIRPLTSPLVGWERGTHHHAIDPADDPRIDSATGVRRVTMIRATDIPVHVRTSSEPATDEEKWLRTPEAYDAVTDVWLDYLSAVEDPSRPYYRL